MGEIKRITLKDIAKIASVSESTVSKCLNGGTGVSEATRKKVCKIAKDLNFQFNVNARNLAKKNSKKVGIVFPEGYYKFNMRHFFGTIEEYLVKYIEKMGYEAIIYKLSKSTLKRNKLTQIVNSGEVDGFLIACRDISSEDIDTIQNYDFPHSFVYYKPNKVWGKMELFTLDNVHSGYLATKYLIDNGCKNIMTITSDDKSQKNYSERTRGFIKAINESSLDTKNIHVLEVYVDFKSGEELAKTIKESYSEIDGIFCQQDEIALGLMKGLKELEYTLPKDLSIIGHDDMEIISYFSPELTTVSQPFENICKNSVISLFNQINGVDEELRKIFLSSIVERETVRVNKK